MVSDQAVAILFLVYLVLPVVAFFLWWLAGWFRRKVFKKGGEPSESEET